MTNDDYAIEQQALAAAWKKRTPTLWPAARMAAPWINQDGKPVGHYAHCLPAEHATANLLPDNHEAIGSSTNSASRGTAASTTAPETTCSPARSSV